jgi:hypothetical protein
MTIADCVGSREKISENGKIRKTFEIPFFVSNDVNNIESLETK